jgi:predicted ArsR family transcriptional regulator
MRASLVLGAGRGPRLAVLELIKRTGGMGVRQLADELGMSYMGVKAHCVALTSAGYLKTWREPSSKGRPVLLHKLTSAGEELFTESAQDPALGILKEAAGLFGATAPQKLLMMYFRTTGERYRSKLEVEAPTERLDALAKLRDSEGRMVSLEADASDWILRECHNPLLALMKEYPGAAAMEEQMIGEVLGIPVLRREEEGMILFSPREVTQRG